MHYNNFLKNKKEDKLKRTLDNEKRIEELRERMEYLIERNNDLLDDEIITASMRLDEAIIDYYISKRKKEACLS